MLVLYRYGLLGLAVYAIVACRVFWYVGKRLIFDKYLGDYKLCLSIAAVMYFIDGIVRNSFVDLLLWYSVVFVLVYGGGNKYRQVRS